MIVSCLDFGCRKFVEVDAPYSRITDGNIFNTDGTAISVLTGLYTKLSGGYGRFIQQKVHLLLEVGEAYPYMLVYPLTNSLSYNGVQNDLLIGYYKNDLNAVALRSEYWREL